MVLGHPAGSSGRVYSGGAGAAAAKEPGRLPHVWPWPTWHKCDFVEAVRGYNRPGLSRDGLGDFCLRKSAQPLIKSQIRITNRNQMRPADMTLPPFELSRRSWFKPSGTLAPAGACLSQFLFFWFPKVHFDDQKSGVTDSLVNTATWKRKGP